MATLYDFDKKYCHRKKQPDKQNRFIYPRGTFVDGVNKATHRIAFALKFTYSIVFYLY